MNPKVQAFVASMDDKNWFRLVVGFAPGIVLGKLASQVGSPGLNVASGVLLGAGLLVYLGWPMLRAHTRADAPSEAVPQSELHPQVASVTMQLAVRDRGKSEADALAKLVAMCNGQASVALELVNVELSVDPDQSYGSAIERAVRRLQLIESRT